MSTYQKNLDLRLVLFMEPWQQLWVTQLRWKLTWGYFSMWIVWSVLYHGIWGQLVYFWNSNDTTGTTLLHSLSLTFTNHVFPISFYFSDPHQVISIRAPQNGSMVQLSCSFQTVGSCYYTVAATLSTDQGGHTPSVSHVGWNWIRVLTVTMSRMKMLSTSGELSSVLPVAPTHCGPDTEVWTLSWTVKAAAVTAAGLRQLSHLSLCCFCDNKKKKLLWFVFLCKPLGGPKMLEITTKL